MLLVSVFAVQNSLVISIRKKQILMWTKMNFPNTVNHILSSIFVASKKGCVRCVFFATTRSIYSKTLVVVVFLLVCLM